MNGLIWTVLILLIAANAVILFLLLKKPKLEQKEDKSEALVLLQQQIQHLNESVNTNIKEMIKSVTQVDATGKQMVNFADQLQSLQDILKNPKQRGVLGEYYLETLLKNVLPP